MGGVARPRTVATRQWSDANGVLVKMVVGGAARHRAPAQWAARSARHETKIHRHRCERMHCSCCGRWADACSHTHGGTRRRTRCDGGSRDRRGPGRAPRVRAARRNVPMRPLPVKPTSSAQRTPTPRCQRPRAPPPGCSAPCAAPQRATRPACIALGNRSTAPAHCASSIVATCISSSSSAPQRPPHPVRLQRQLWSTHTHTTHGRRVRVPALPRRRTVAPLARAPTRRSGDGARDALRPVAQLREQLRRHGRVRRLKVRVGAAHERLELVAALQRAPRNG